MNLIKFDSTSQLDRIKFYEDLKKYPLTKPSLNFIATMLMVVILFLFAIKPTITTINELKNKIVEYEKLNSQLSIKKATLTRLASDYNSIQLKLDLVESAIPSSPNYELFEKEIRYFLQKRGMELISLNFSQFPLFGETITKKDSNNETSDSEIISSIDFSLAVRGRYDEIKNLIQNFNEHNRLMHVSNVVFESNKKNQIEDNIVVNIRGNIYYYNKKQ